MKEIVVDPLWLFGAMFSVMGLAFGWYIVRLDTMVEDLRKEIIVMNKEIGKLQNADVTCTNTQNIMLKDMSHIRETMLKMIARRFMRRKMRDDWKHEIKKDKERPKHRELVQLGDLQLGDLTHE
jgi:hypothetical protein